MLDEIVEFIKNTYPRKSGIIYCYSKAECGKVYDYLSVWAFLCLLHSVTEYYNNRTMEFELNFIMPVSPILKGMSVTTSG